jgi:murein DD-endopeptidase MepM/ murein hydrolase activator NlpD
VRKLTVMIVPDRTARSRQFVVPVILLRAIGFSLMALSGLFGYFINDYIELRSIRETYELVSKENEGLRGEANILMGNLDEVKRSLKRVQDYAGQLTEITTKKVNEVRREAGIGPLSKREEVSAVNNKSAPKPTNFLPSGLNPDHLAFRPVFERLAGIGEEANKQALELQHLLANLSTQKALLQSIPSVAPVGGWISSGFGRRISPFTGERSLHLGIDIAADIGKPIFAPADGIVIFAGAKEGFGNFLMIAHGYGIVSHYGHNAQLFVQPGQKVNRGDQIATVGMTGRTTGPHLHYEVWINGRSVDPRRFLLGSSDTELVAH